jgi:uncharacterized protein (TIGR02145 family)
MKKKNKNLIYTFVIMGFFLIITNSCKKDGTIIKKDPVITWADPANINFGTQLSATQLNATANIPGNFVYIPVLGTKLNEGTNQKLEVNFTPTDISAYNITNKKVKINVILVDADNNIYHTVIIDKQIWTVENLKTTKYNDGSTINNISENNAWTTQTTGAYCWYDNDNANKSTYGALYNWYSVNTGKLCLTGFHVPTDDEWTKLTTYLGGASIAGGKLKETGTTHWLSPNTDATNVTGFNALPGGYRHYSLGWFTDIGYYGYWWSSTEKDVYNSWYQQLWYNYVAINRNGSNKFTGYSVRCLQN